MSPQALALQLRVDVRRILSSFPAGRGVSAEWLTQHINDSKPYVVTKELVEVALVWNQTARGWCDYQVNQLTEVQEWSLTDKGRKQEGLV